MARQTTTGTRRPKAGVEAVSSGDVLLVTVAGLVDEHFPGFGTIEARFKTVVINVTHMTRMTSFGVRQWLKGMDALPKTISDLYLLGCPTFFVDQLNMVLNFGGHAQVLTVIAPYACPSCGVDSGETIDVLAERGALAKGGVSEKECGRCTGKLEFEETPESYFSFVNKYAATSLSPAAAQVLTAHGLYKAAEVSADKPPRIIKLVHGAVTYFRIIGTIGAMFRARPFLVGAEGEVVIDLGEVERFEQFGQREWRRLLKTLAGQVPTITLVDVNESFLAIVPESITLAKNIAIWSVLVPHRCLECSRIARRSQKLGTWPLPHADRVCSTCGGASADELAEATLAPLHKATTHVPAASAKLIEHRDEVLSRAQTDANVAQAGESATALLIADDTILGKYKIVRRLSAGGMAEVFLAKQVGIGGFEKPVALKRIQRQLLETRHLAIDLFLNEAKIAGLLMHPNIVQVLDVGEVGGALYLAMEYVWGKDLRHVIKKLRTTRTTMPLGDACFVVREVAQGLHHAYWSTDMEGNRLSVVHRDVSPHNIVLGYDGNVKLLDFGVAMSAVTEQTETMIVGKWMYMSPEHTTHQPLDHRSDLFSLGVIMYLLCTGNMPFTGNDPKAIVRKIRSGQYVPLESCAPTLPAALRTLIGSMLSPKPEDRPRTGREVVVALDEITRAHGIESSAAQLAAFLAQSFADDREDVAGQELRRISMTMESYSGRLGIGSGPTAPGSLEDSKSPGSISTSAASHSSRITPASMDASFSLARRSSGEISSSVPKQDLGEPLPRQLPVAPAPPFPVHWSVIAVAMVAVAVVTYLVVR